MVNEFGCAWILATFGFVQQCIKIIAETAINSKVIVRFSFLVT
jgi:hypothetical protein